MAQTKSSSGKRAPKPKRPKKNQLFDVSAPDEGAELRALTRALELAQGFKLIFVRCNQPAQRKRLTEKLRERLPKLQIEEVEFKSEIHHLLDELRLRFDEPPHGAVFVAGLEYSMPKSETAHATPMVANLNAARNSFPVHIPCPLVLWLPEYALTAIQRGAPDFFSVRSGAYYFASTLEETMSHAVSLTAGEPWKVANLTDEEKVERIGTILDLIREYQALPEEQRSHQQELSLMGRLAHLYLARADWDQARQWYEQCLTLAHTLNDEKSKGQTYNNLGSVFLSLRDFEQAERHYRLALEIKERVGDMAGTTDVLNNLGALFLEQHRLTEASDVLLERLRRIREAGDLTGTASSLVNLGSVRMLQGRLKEAEATLREAFELSVETKDRATEAHALANLARVFALSGEWPEAGTAALQGLQIWRDLGSRFSEGELLQLLAEIEWLQGQHGPAVSYAKQAVVAFTETGHESAAKQVALFVSKLEANLRESMGDGMALSPSSNSP